jgi:hypothetical protein
LVGYVVGILLSAIFSRCPDGRMIILTLECGYQKLQNCCTPGCVRRLLWLPLLIEMESEQWVEREDNTKEIECLVEGKFAGKE